MGSALSCRACKYPIASLLPESFFRITIQYSGAESLRFLSLTKPFFRLQGFNKSSTNMPTTATLTPTDFSLIIDKQKKYFDQGHTLSADSRLKALRNLKKAIEQHEPEILEALAQDLRKSAFEAWTTELGVLYQEIDFHTRHLKKWMRGRRVPTNQLIHFWSQSRVLPQPYGQTLIIAPWNYPFHLALLPLVGALSAGNTAVIKPSELTPSVAEVCERVVAAAFNEQYVKVISGGPEVSQALLSLKWDMIFFTGSPRVGKLVYEAAARHLTPVVLELGGKSPTLVSRHANIDIAARRIAWGKWINAGQTCIAPDYLLVEKPVKDQLTERLKHYITQFYGANAAQNPEYPAIVNTHHTRRLSSYIENAKVLHGGEVDIEKRFVAPTLIEASAQDEAMQEEIFGPVLPIIAIDNLQQAIDFINARPKPLALYLFTESKAEQQEILQKTSSGSVAINEVIMQVANEHLPFGGVGNSGLGNYHGKRSFLTFSHERSVLRKATWIDIPLRYPPYGDKLKWVKRLLK